MPPVLVNVARSRTIPSSILTSAYRSTQLVLTSLSLLLTLAAGCGQSIQVPDINGLYTRTARYRDAPRNPVIVIPGILGSKLTDDVTGRIVWGAFAGSYANPQTAEGARLVALPMREGASLRELRDDVQPRGALDR